MAKAHVLWLIVTCGLLVPVPLEHGSSAVFLLRQDSITVAADSRVSNIQGDRLPDTCKLAVSDSGMMFANVGKLNDFLGTFISTAQRIMRGNRDVAKAAESLDGIVPRLTVLARNIFNQNPSYYAAKVDNKSLYEAGFGIMTTRGPQMATRSYTATRSSKLGTFHINIVPQQCLDNCVSGTAIPLGNSDHIKQFVIEHPFYTSTQDPVEAVRMFINLEISADKKTVGPPIAIVQVRSSGVNWIDHGVCK
jgi:hypothetical protein